MNTTFSYQVRILLCSNCGAPLEAPLGGGQTTCRYCSAMNQIAMRDERLAFTAAAQPPISEEERLTRLRAQDGKPLLPPPGLTALFPNGQLPAWKVQEALSVWQTTRHELRASSSYDAVERLLFLTMILSNHFSEQSDFMRQRAMFESALEAFTLPRHRQMMRGCLSRSACRSGDLAAAEQWLAPCEQRSDDLEMDSAYRFSRAFLDTARGDFNAALRLLGGSKDEVPIMDAMDPACAVLRANAWERLGNVGAAVGALRQALGSEGSSGRQSITKFIELNPSLQLCRQSYPAATAQHAVVAGKAAAAAASGGIHKVFIPLGALMLILSVVCVVLAIVDLAADLGGGLAGGAGVALLTVLPLGLVFGGIGLVMRQAALKAERLRVHGVSGTARVLGVTPTGLSINNVPQLAFQLQILLPGRAPYQATAKMLMHRGAAGAMMPGAEVPVRADPQDPSSVMIETH